MKSHSRVCDCPSFSYVTCGRSVSKGAKKHAEKTRIIEALKDSRGNRAEAAKTLKISRAGLYNKLREYGLS